MRPEDYYQRAGTRAELPESRRQFRRINCKGRAVVIHGQDICGVYLIDVSPAGFGFYCPVQLFPLDQIRLSCDQCDDIKADVHRCRRIQDACYACGAQFSDGPMSPARYREFLEELRS